VPSCLSKQHEGCRVIRSLQSTTIDNFPVPCEPTSSLRSGGQTPALSGPLKSARFTCATMVMSSTQYLRALHRAAMTTELEYYRDGWTRFPHQR
jgi:hypothetical protein